MASAAPARTVPRPTAELPALTGIRAVASVLILLCHLRFALAAVFPAHSSESQRLADLGVGVDLFFVLSGFIISYNYWDRFQSFNGSAYRTFLVARFARLYPVHLLTLLAALTMYGATQFRGLGTNNDLSSWSIRTFIANLFLVQAWAPGDPVSWNYPAWSISCEWLAYLCFPLIALTRMHRHPRRAIALAVMGTAFVGVANQAESGDNLLRISCEFFAGSMAYCAYRSLGVWRPGVLLSLATLLAAGVFFSGVSVFCVVPAFVLVIYALAAGRGPVASVLSTPVALYWGRASYSLYMTHALVFMALGKLYPATTPFRFAVWVFVCGAVAALTYHLVEEPARVLIRGTRRKRAPVEQEPDMALAPVAD